MKITKNSTVESNKRKDGTWGVIIHLDIVIMVFIVIIQNDRRGFENQNTLIFITTVPFKLRDIPLYASNSRSIFCKVKMAPRKQGSAEVAPPLVTRDWGGIWVFSSHARGVGERVTCAQSQAKIVAKKIWDRIPMVVRDEIDTIEKELWEEVQTIPMEYIREEVK